jgi:molybdopterin-containing oxidoreductase family membrane subunit
MVISLLAGLAGLGAWIYQMFNGLQVTGLDNTIIWGLTIAVFFAIIAGGAGLLTLCGLSEFLGFMTPRQRRQGIAFAIAAMCAGGILVIMDLGHPQAFFYLMTSFNLSSFSVLDFWFLLACLVTAVIYLIVVRDERSHRVIGSVAVALGVGIIVVEGILLANNSSHHLWASSISVISFLSGAFLAGSALLAAIAPDKRRLLLIGIVVSAFVTLAEVGTSLVAGTDAARFVMFQVVAGAFAPWFYFQLVTGLALPFVLALKTRFTGFAALAVVLGLSAEKLWLLCAGETQVWSQFHHIGPAQAVAQIVYYPTLTEVGLTIGALGAGVFLFLLINNVMTRHSASASQEG